MGWASANSIFDRTATVLLASGAEDYVITDTLAALIGELTDHDWDTLDESIEEFRDKPAVMAAFRRAAPSWLRAEDLDEKQRYNQLCWIAAQMTWYGSDLAELLRSPDLKRGDILTAKSEEGKTLCIHIQELALEFSAMFPDIHTLDDARKKFEVES